MSRKSKRAKKRKSKQEKRRSTRKLNKELDRIERSFKKSWPWGGFLSAADTRLLYSMYVQSHISKQTMQTLIGLEDVEEKS